MNTPATPQTTQPSAAGERLVSDRAEFARLIHQHRGLRVVLFVADRNTVASCQTECCGFHVPAKTALDQLARFAFDAFEWRADEFGPRLWHYAAPLQLQLERRRECLAARIPHAEARLAQPIQAEEEWSRKARHSIERQLAADRTELARLDAQLLALRTAAVPASIRETPIATPPPTLALASGQTPVAA